MKSAFLQFQIMDNERYDEHKTTTIETIRPFQASLSALLASFQFLFIYILVWNSIGTENRKQKHLKWIKGG